MMMRISRTAPPPIYTPSASIAAENMRFVSFIVGTPSTVRAVTGTVDLTVFLA